MIDKFQNLNSFTPTHTPSATDSIDFVVPQDGQLVVVLDADITYLATSGSMSDIFTGFSIVKVERIVFANATDTQISDTLNQKNWKIIFITADKGLDILKPKANIAIVRFTNNSTSSATQLQTRLGLLWRLTQTTNFKVFENWFNKDIRLGTKNAYYVKDGIRSEIPKFYLPHQNSPDYRNWFL